MLTGVKMSNVEAVVSMNTQSRAPFPCPWVESCGDAQPVFKSLFEEIILVWCVCGVSSTKQGSRAEREHRAPPSNSVPKGVPLYSQRWIANLDPISFLTFMSSLSSQDKKKVMTQEGACLGGIKLKAPLFWCRSNMRTCKK